MAKESVKFIFNGSTIAELPKKISQQIFCEDSYIRSNLKPHSTIFIKIPIVKVSVFAVLDDPGPPQTFYPRAKL
jgi:hypothetical protein